MATFFAQAEQRNAIVCYPAKAKRIFDDAWGAARADLEKTGATPEIQTLVHDVDAIRTAMNAMATEATMTLSYFSIEAPEKAAPLMAGMNRRFGPAGESADRPSARPPLAHDPAASDRVAPLVAHAPHLTNADAFTLDARLCGAMHTIC